MVIDQDHGESHCLALSRLATDDNALTSLNDTVPVLDELMHGNMVFRVFPRLNDWNPQPWFYSFSEVLDTVTQTVEVGRYSRFPLIQYNSVLSTGNCFLS